MNAVILISRLILALVFAVAGIGKLTDRRSSQRSLEDFGIPTNLATPLGVMLPLTELGFAIALLLALTAWWAALGTLGLLLIFIGAISLNLARGHRPDCHCFGVLYSTPIGWSTLIRNGILAALAVLIIWQGPNHAGPSGVGWLFKLDMLKLLGLMAAVGVFGLLVFEGWLLFHLLRQQGRLLLRIETIEHILESNGALLAEPMPTAAAGLPIGTPAPSFQLPSLHGESLTLDDLCARGKPVILLFSDPGCGPCNALAPEIAAWQQSYGSQLTITLISRGSVEANRAKSNKYGLTQVLMQEDREVAYAYQASGTPCAVMIWSDGRIGTRLACGADEIRALMEKTLGRQTSIRPMGVLPKAAEECGCGKSNGDAATSATAGSKIGDPDPELELPDLTGSTVGLDDFRGHDTLILFWNPNCGFCARMLDDLKAWEANPPNGAPQLLIVSMGSVEEINALGFRSKIVIDQSFNTGYAFGAQGTPSAVLVDANGYIASDVAAGAPSIMALVGVPTSAP